MNVLEANEKARLAQHVIHKTMRQADARNGYMSNLLQPLPPNFHKLSHP